MMSQVNYCPNLKSRQIGIRKTWYPKLTIASIYNRQIGIRKHNVSSSVSIQIKTIIWIIEKNNPDYIQIYSDFYPN